MCPLCSLDVETEYHFLLICPRLAKYRDRYLPRFVYENPSEAKYSIFISSTNKSLKLSFAKYIRYSLQFRETVL